MSTTSTINGIEYVSQIFKILCNWMVRNNISSFNQILFRGLTGIYDRHHICSGAAIRLKQNALYNKPNTIDAPLEKDGEMEKIMVYDPAEDSEISEFSTFSYSDYISYHQHLIQNAKTTDPANYKNLSDLEILADLQHYGAATCLVDFSRNMLTSLWFACREQSGKIDYPKDEYQGHYGILYCYNTQYDIIEKNNLVRVSPDDVNESISSLLGRTKKITNFCSDSDYTFMLWEPTPLNARITRQDSVFLFGLSRFVIKKHPILSIIIHDDIKPAIVKALDQVFNINAKTIFQDKQGYATINSKFDRLSINQEYSEKFVDLYQHGLDDMFGGYYSMALEFFYAAENKLIEECRKQYKMKDEQNAIGSITFQIPDEKDALLTLKYAELFLSKAICYKHLTEEQHTDTLNYNSNSLQEYLKAQTMFKKTFDYFEDKKKRTMYFRKYLRTTNDVIQMLYKCKDFSNCIEACKLAIDTIDNYNRVYNDTHYSGIFCKIASLELYILQLLTVPHKEKGQYIISFDSFCKQIDISRLDSNSDNFNRLLISFFKYFKCMYVNGLKKQTYSISETINQQTSDDFQRELSTLYKMSPIEDIMDYSAWDFTEFKEIIEAPNFSNSNKCKLQELLATMISARDYYRILCLNNNKSD